MADINYRPSHLPTKLGTIKNQDSGHLFELLGLLDIEMAEYLFSGNETSLDYADIINNSFGEFQTWCWEIYVSMNDNKDKAYHFFKDALIRYQLIKDKNFFEKENQTYHVLVALPISKEGDRMQQMAKINYEYLNHAIDILEDLVKRIETNPPKKKRRIEIYGFYVKRPKCLNDTFNQLIRESIISDKTEKKDFAQVFTGGNPNNKIIWLKGPGLLRYFIKEIDGKGIRYTGKNIWNATVSCFKNKDGTEFNKEQFRHGKIPKEVEIIESIIDTINEDAYSED